MSVEKLYIRNDTVKLTRNSEKLKEFGESGEFLPEYCFNSKGELLSEKEIMSIKRDSEIKTDC
ncbi:hypothetical protein L1O59_000943 [Salmonella enterica]|nr:hypothetical protein [Salmonella enterica subsp. diarizonae]EEB7406982.1 hypothetical protein [Salmonella enterica]EHP4002833.1 hypothetical protein [Salmonella enterica]EIT2135954.1 hypothetical protein [Salmonella enterica]EIZ2109999.1 hypothetical protein [Salmonella enterica]